MSVTSGQNSSGFVSIFHSINKQPLLMWEKKIRNGRIKRIRDEDLYSLVIEILGPKSVSTYITCPQDPAETLKITQSVFNLTVKNLDKVFSFDVQILDDKNVKRRFKVSTSTTIAEAKPFACKLPLFLEEGWNQITLPLQQYTARCYGTNYLQTLRVQIYASCRLRRVFFSNKICTEEEIPLDFRMNHLAIPKRITEKFGH